MDQDDRFKDLSSNPIFRRVPKREAKVPIDRRFKGMFEDEKFKLTYRVDKRGRPNVSTTDEDLKKYYNLEEGDEDEDKSEESSGEAEESDEVEEIDEEKVEEKSDQDQNQKKKIISKKSSDGVKVKLSESDKKKLRDQAIDYARGEGVFAEDESESEDSSSDESELEESESELNTHYEWGEMDKDAERIRDDESTTRLALMNMDWDKLAAKDLFVLFTSFLPTGGALKTVKIFTSDYGKKRLEEENVKGPIELVNREIGKKTVSLDKSDSEQEEEDGDSLSDDQDDNDNDDDDCEEGRGFNMEKLRRYQLNRLKYYYAVLEFDSKETADKVYKESDGMEYESSATKIDLRFIPQDMTFDDDPKDICDTLTSADKYRPRFFTTTALQQMKVDLTWDETDPLRKELTDKIFNPKENIDDDDIRVYLASSSEESDLEDPTDDLENDTISSKVDPIEKYRLLLDNLEEESEKKKREKDNGLEITWGVGLKEKAKDLVKKKQKEQQVKDMTQWDQFLEKRREKKKERRLQEKDNKSSKTKKESDSGSDSSDQEESDDGDGDGDGDQPFSDDDVDVDLNDPFFRNEIKNNEILKSKLGTKTGKKDQVEDSLYLRKKKELENPNRELELLLMDEEVDTKKHFSLKRIMDSENPSNSKKKKLKKLRKNKKNGAEKVEETFNDDFQVNLNDDRFDALFTSHKFNIDPSDPNYKKTKGMETIISEKQKRRERSIISKSKGQDKSGSGSLKEPKETVQEIPTDNKKSRDHELQALIKSVKRKANQVHINNTSSSSNKKKKLK